MPKSNIIFMHSHNTGQFVEPYGHAVPTPNLFRLAQEGVLFRKAFAAAPTCSPSRASFLSGMYPHSCGMLGLAHRGFPMTDYDQHIVRVLNQIGYLTATSGVEHTAPEINTIGYDHILSGLDTNYPDLPKRLNPAEAAAAFLKNAPDQPFFLNLGLNETHRPFPKAEPEKYLAEDARYCIPPRPFPDTPETRADVADFKAAARIMDDAYGLVLDALDETGLADNTFVFCFADHGLQFPRNMCNLTDHGIAVYFIARGPQHFQGGQVLDQMVSLIDLVPTVYDLLNVDQPDHVEGKSLLPLVEAPDATHHDHIFAEVNYHASYEPMRCVRTSRYKYIRRYDQRDQLVLPNVDDTPSKVFLLDQDWIDQPRHQEMLYDLIFDPDETNNLIDQPQTAAIQAELSHRLDQWMKDTNDPILATGHVPAPKGSQINDPDGQSPKDATITM
ncbi:MAG: sulfatase [Chloroflexota bacterium]